MEATTRPASRLTSRIAYAHLALALALASGCATGRRAQPPRDTPRQQDSGGPAGPLRNGVAVSAEPMGPPETFGPPTPEPAPVYGPEPMSIRPVVLVLGPGLARGFAHVGVLRALSEAKIPVGAIVGTEMGALIGTLYSMDGNINHFEWALLKFKDDAFLRPKGLLTGLFAKSQQEQQARHLEAELDRIFGKRDLSEMKIPTRVEIALQDQSASSLLDHGAAAEALRAAMAAPELYPAASWNGVGAVAATSVRPFPIAEARALGIGPVVVVDVLSRAEEARSKDASDLKDADLVIRPDVNAIGPMEFQKRTDAAFSGKKAARDAMPEIRHLVGLPSEDPANPAEPKTVPEGDSHT